jgi:two-component system chemotaxis response regulator CheY
VGQRLKNVLIVDDSATMRRMVRVSLRTLDDVAINEAGNGLEALERLALTPVDLIILDLNMPDMHGLEVVEFMRRHPIYQTVPVIVLTTRADDSSRTMALDAGASLYLTKPFDPGTLAARARELMNSP